MSIKVLFCLARGPVGFVTSGSFLVSTWLTFFDVTMDLVSWKVGGLRLDSLLGALKTSGQLPGNY